MPRAVILIMRHQPLLNMRITSRRRGLVDLLRLHAIIRQEPTWLAPVVD
jgi:hypothetical protein